MAYTTINKSKDQFDEKIYLGSSSAVTVSGLQFQPDLVWVKDRDNGNNHCLVDAVRGVGKYIQSDNASVETNNATNSISAFNSDGFTTGTANPANESGSATKGFMSWNWKANGSGSANTAGSISSTVSANTTAGFSIVKYTGTGAGATVGHGLGVKPNMIIVKNLDAVQNSAVYHSSLGATKYMDISSTASVASDLGGYLRFNSTEPTTSVFSVGQSPTTSGSGQSHIAYCFAEKQGYSKFTTYNGANSNDGAFLYLGFKPSFLMVKAVSGSNTPASQPWTILDNKRSSTNGNNVIGYKLFPNTSGAENTDGNNHVDFLSNGVKFRGGNDATNGNNIYLVMAFAEAPLVGTNNVPCTAR